MRADLWLVEKGHYESRARAQAAIKAGLVFVDGKPVKKPSQLINSTANIQAEQEHPWVSRGGVKLDFALKEFGINPLGKICLDVGASTGGFTEVLRARGAKHVYAVDVGSDQLHQRLQSDTRISSMEKTDARDLTQEKFFSAPELIVCDASFISAMKVLEIPMQLARAQAELMTLVKPQFEVGKSGLGRGGIVKSEALSLAALQDVSAWVAAQGWEVVGSCKSPIKGGSGNTEYLLYARK
jgi:23S rRNA (cytidine1920-2'-O)/16S rRNA (cytidine1409-2'-O)-methyltransferase